MNPDPMYTSHWIMSIITKELSGFRLISRIPPDKELSARTEHLFNMGMPGSKKTLMTSDFHLQNVSIVLFNK